MPSSIKLRMCWSKRPVLMMSAMMMGLEVAPVAPSARFVFTKSGSIESSHSLVPVAIKDCSDMAHSSSKKAGGRAGSIHRGAAEASSIDLPPFPNGFPIRTQRPQSDRRRLQMVVRRDLQDEFSASRQSVQPTQLLHALAPPNQYVALRRAGPAQRRDCRCLKRIPPARAHPTTGGSASTSSFGHIER